MWGFGCKGALSLSVTLDPSIIIGIQGVLDIELRIVFKKQY